MTTVLVTGAAGYIGSHAVLGLLRGGYDVVGVDNFDNSSPVAIERVQRLAGRTFEFAEFDLRQSESLDRLFTATKPDVVMHFAGLKAVGESVSNPHLYYSTNVGTSISLLDVMERHEVKRLVFSSSCTVYGDPRAGGTPLTEACERAPCNPYGRSKVIVEQLLEDAAAADAGWRIFSLRYFNPVGADESGMIGEDPTGPPNNLMPFVMQTAAGQRPSVSVFGGDYPTPDGTCIRDYIHVLDVVRGHLRALEHLESADGFEALNLGTGIGSSVLEVVDAARRASGRAIPHQIVGRRDGDAVRITADPSLAFARLGWKATHDLERMCRDHWHWQAKNPNGYR